jgi:hypothetical protein
MYKLTQHDNIIRLSDGACIPPAVDNTDYKNYLKWVAEGGVPEPYVPPPLTSADFETAIDKHVDKVANSFGYTSIYTAVSYRNDPHQKFSAEAEALFQWRSAVWVKALEVQADVLEGQIPQPTTVEELIEMLPLPPTNS